MKLLSRPNKEPFNSREQKILDSLILYVEYYNILCEMKIASKSYQELYRYSQERTMQFGLCAYLSIKNFRNDYSGVIKEVFGNDVVCEYVFPVLFMDNIDIHESIGKRAEKILSFLGIILNNNTDCDEGFKNKFNKTLANYNILKKLENG